MKKKSKRAHGRSLRRDSFVANAGKEFEKQFKDSVPKDMYFLRLHDSANGFSENRQKGGFAVKSPYDCLLMKIPKVYALELKSVQGKSLSFENLMKESKGNKVIKKHQIEQLRIAQSKGLNAGFIINFRSINKTYYLPIQAFDRITNMQMGVKSSINEMDIINYATVIPQKLRKTTYAYDVTVLFKE